MAALTDLTLAGMKAGLAAKQFTARELVQAHVTAVEEARVLNAFLVGLLSAKCVFRQFLEVDSFKVKQRWR